MNFLFVGTNPENTGAATHFVALAQALAGAGHHVEVVACAGGLIAEELDRSGIQVHFGHFRNALDPAGYAPLLRLARRLRPDWLVGNFGKEYWPLLLAGHALGVRVALFRHRAPAMRAFSGYAIPRLAARFFAVSRYARQAYLQRGVPEALVQVLYNPVNMDSLRPDPQRGRQVRAMLGLPEEAIVVGYSGRLQVGKGIFPLMEAVSAAMAVEPALHCLWLGDGPDAARLHAQSSGQATSARHRFVGWVNDATPYYNAMSMLAFPSLAPETFGRVSVEAQASEVPVLASRIGGAVETLEAGVSGELLPPGDVGAWRDAIVRMCDAPRRQRMGQAGRQFVQRHFAGAVIAAQFVQALQAPRRAPQRLAQAQPEPH
ncbi:glycosyltransferase family 4 protein [Xanthomonas sp. NCPPB 2654]|uniref:glycosyltransferase family 4 protein n=1 Tax=unclassified Xanthomonas TaxID=2643310 RepID=UPI0021DFC9B0|nr:MULTISPECIES: glycosyltransferase family 4 protein [unclassified Xanthomonas]MDL5366763.1 glycosyltransferase family 4 protein [Xanthomonas sp. NCPPB 2654]UYC19735.1 glycosyltransferase family 4 protein [Xanthomonas sp. CFBP 8443]